MLRIARVHGRTGDSIVTLRLEGKLVGPWVGELRSTCDELHVPASYLALNLSGVTFVDSAGVDLLRDLMRCGATIEGCRSFISELLSLGHG